MTKGQPFHSFAYRRADELGWMRSAACAHATPAEADAFFPDGDPGPHAAPRVAIAKAICAGCVVRVDCLDYAVNALEPDGIWGGMTTEERKRERRRRQIRARQERVA